MIHTPGLLRAVATAGVRERWHGLLCVHLQSEQSANTLRERRTLPSKCLQRKRRGERGKNEQVKELKKKMGEYSVELKLKFALYRE